MKTTSFKVLTVLLWFVCAAHVLIGLSLNVSSGLTEIVASIYGAQVEWTPQFVYILKPLGVFMFVLGLLAAVAARDPLANKEIVYGFCLIFVLRALQRLVYLGDIRETFGIGASRNITMSVFFLLLAAAIFWLFRKVDREGAEAATVEFESP